jgi:hypothetical protein
MLASFKICVNAGQHYVARRCCGMQPLPCELHLCLPARKVVVCTAHSVCMCVRQIACVCIIWFCFFKLHCVKGEVGGL